MESAEGWAALLDALEQRIGKRLVKTIAYLGAIAICVFLSNFIISIFMIPISWAVWHYNLGDIERIIRVIQSVLSVVIFSATVALILMVERYKKRSQYILISLNSADDILKHYLPDIVRNSLEILTLVEIFLESVEKAGLESIPIDEFEAYEQLKQKAQENTRVISDAQNAIKSLLATISNNKQ